MAKSSKGPKKPKQSASAKTWEKFDERYKAWEKKHKEKITLENKKKALIKKYA